MTNISKNAELQQSCITAVMPSSCLFNGQRRSIIKETESFYFFAVGNMFKWNYAEKQLCTDLN